MTHPKPVEPEALGSHRSPMATATKEAKARYDALALVLRAQRAYSADEAIDLCEYVLAGPEEVD